jgi:tetratricopeptide (TPR) repeat protein
MDINVFFAKLDTFFANKDMQAAEAYMKESLNAAEDSGDLSSATAICNELGGYYRKLSRYKEGAALYEKALAYLERLGLSGSEHHATTLINYATTCTQAGEREKALFFFQKAAEIFAEKGLTADYRVATLHNNISSLYQDAADLPNAEKHLRMALSVLEGLAGTGLEVAITYTNWAQLCLAADRLADAEEKVLLALSAFEKAGGSHDTHYAAAVNVSGKINYIKGDYPTAIAQFKEAMELIQQEFGDGNMSYAVLCDNTARCYRQLGDAELAKTFADKAEAIYGRVRA